MNTPSDDNAFEERLKRAGKPITIAFAVTVLLAIGAFLLWNDLGNAISLLLVGYYAGIIVASVIFRMTK